VITVDRLGKMYRLYDRPQDRLKHSLLWRFGRHYGREFWALRDVSFEVRRGETFGIIGRNGAGKSTLLQILAGILEPTVGEVHVRGRVAALLELGSGFNPEFTGRENVFLNGAILGIPRSEMERHLDDIVAFADIGPFIDQPVKLYSSGMLMRLAFAVATHVEADVLLIDEVLAVGDVFFRQKCYRWLETLRERGVTIVLVSHAMTEVEQFCRRALLLDGGRGVFVGPAVEAVKRYYLLEQARPSEVPLTETSPPVVVFESVSTGEDFWPSPEAFLDLSGAVQVSDGGPVARASPYAMPRVGRRGYSPRGRRLLFFTSSRSCGTSRSLSGGSCFKTPGASTFTARIRFNTARPSPSGSPEGVVYAFVKTSPWPSDRTSTLLKWGWPPCGPKTTGASRLGLMRNSTPGFIAFATCRASGPWP
jgi:ABC-type polysaccharide/polyol phosphate transport system ATPase subunit